MAKYEVKPVVSDYGVYENEELKLICSYLLWKKMIDIKVVLMEIPDLLQVIFTRHFQRN